MVDFFKLSTAERLEALDLAANTSGLLPHLLEKDIWVVWSLRHLFVGPYADHLVFKGGTSLSKAYGVIRRGRLLAGGGFSQRDVTGDARRAHLLGEGYGDSCFLRAGRVSRWRPLRAPLARPTRLDAGGFTDAAIADKALARAVADHKSAFFAEKNAHGKTIDYYAAVAGGLQLVPDDGALAKLATDYQHMVDDGLFLDDAEPFEALMERCQAIQQKANAKQPP